MKPAKIWSGWAEDMPDHLKSPRTPSQGYVILFDTGDIVVMPSDQKLTREDQNPLDEMIMHILKQSAGRNLDREDAKADEEAFSDGEKKSP